VSDFGVREVARLLGMPRSAILGLVRAGFVAPRRGARGAFRFSFRDLIVLRMARALRAARVPPRRITRSLRELRRRLPATAPLSGLRIRAVGDHVVVGEGRRAWQADSGQYLLDLEVSVSGESLNLLAREPIRDAEHWFERGVAAEAKQPERARDAYERALAIDPTHLWARVNLGRALHDAGRFEAAERVYRKGLRYAAGQPLLLYNLGVLLEDAGRRGDAIAAYRAALEADPAFADCHYNLALSYEAQGDPRGAIRHMAEYRRLTRSG
jgi:tetratricopeptide (TPR) repeat protein